MAVDERDVATLLRFVQHGIHWTDLKEAAESRLGWDSARARRGQKAASRHVTTMASTLKPSGLRILDKFRDEDLEGTAGLEARGATEDVRHDRPLAPSARRRRLLWELTRSNEKYARPFTSGEFATMSIIGTEDWQDYADTVLQMVQVDTLLNIEELLLELVEQLASDPEADTGSTQ